MHRTALRVAREHWPDEWTRLEPRLVTLASWVGYDQDGRTDLTWTRTITARLADKLAMIERYRGKVGKLQASATGDFLDALEPLEAMLATASATVADQLELVEAANRDPSKTAAFGRAMVAGRDKALVTTAPLIALIEAALPAAPDDERREELLVMRSSMRTHGLGLAHIHVRLNSSQLHNAVRRQVGLETEPNDPANRRSYFNTINDMLVRVRPTAISFGSVMEERASAKQLMMTVAQIVKFIDAETPIRFLIAETETGFTLLAALYYARQFGVEDRVEISPLFETEEAFERGQRVIEEALKSPHYRAYLERQGRIAVQFGFSDSGRFIGQMAATFRIEGLRLRHREAARAPGLGKLEAVLFNTHGESIGRGGHPLTLADRFRYAAPPISRMEFEQRGLRVKEEISFQGGEGYLPFMTPAAAIASMRQILAFAFDVSDETGNDPIYAAPDYAYEFFATVQQEFSDLVDDPDYAALAGPVRREPALSNRIAAGRARDRRRTAVENRASFTIESDTQQRDFAATRLHGGYFAWSWARGFEGPGNVPCDARKVGSLSALAADGYRGAGSHRNRCVARLCEYAQSRDVAQWSGAQQTSRAGASAARVGAPDGTPRSLRSPRAADPALAIGSIVAAGGDGTCGNGGAPAADSFAWDPGCSNPADLCAGD